MTTAIHIGLPAPHVSQRRVLDEARRFNVVACGRRWGKTTLGIDRIVRPALEGQPTAWYCPTYKMLTETWRYLSTRLLAVVVHRSEQEHRLDLLGGGSIECWSLETPDVSRGRKYALVVLDEAASVRELERAWQEVIRPTLTDLRGDAWFLSTPRGLNYFHELYEVGQDLASMDWAAWRMPTRLNPHLDPAEIEQARRDLAPSVFAQEYEAEFTTVAGAAFPEFRAQDADGRPYHVVPTLALPRAWRRVGGHDWGYAAPSYTCFGAVDPEGGIVIYRELAGRGWHPDEIARRVVAAQGADFVPVIWAGVDLWASYRAHLSLDQLQSLREAGQGQLSLADQYARAGLLTVQPTASTDRLAGVQRIHDLLRERDDAVPYLRIMDCCPVLIRTLQYLELDERRTEDVRTDYAPDTVVRDDPYDALRYLVMSTPDVGPSRERHAATVRRLGWRGG